MSGDTKRSIGVDADHAVGLPREREEDTAILNEGPIVWIAKIGVFSREQGTPDFDDIRVDLLAVAAEVRAIGREELCLLCAAGLEGPCCFQVCPILRAGSSEVPGSTNETGCQLDREARPIIARCVNVCRGLHTVGPVYNQLLEQTGRPARDICHWDAVSTVPPPLP
jgi:hypothetical protein